uniref:Phospholipase A1 n=1 Tax=Cannabis sativa TaxID=3483 RepID=A0A803PMG4_CANSA
MAGNIGRRWRVLSGEGEWQGLLDPLDSDLRRYIIHYGERVQAVVDSFIEESKSDNYGLSRYPKSNLFTKVGLESGNNPFKYEVKKYFYASAAFIGDTCPPANELPVSPNAVAGNSKWLGFVAVTSDEGKEVLGRRDILVSFRGTMPVIENCVDLKIGLVSASQIIGNDNNPKILAAVRELVDQYKDEEVSITFTGHSMGAAVATLAATDVTYNSYNKPTGRPDKAFPVTAIVFASPHLGNNGFKATFSNLNNLHVLRLRNKRDPVPDLPVPIPIVLDYVHVGQELVIDTLLSPYLKEAERTVHELEVYLHGVAGTQGSSGGFRLEVERDIKLVNKRLDGLKDEYVVTSMWWVEKNKGMIQLDDGSWVLMDREMDNSQHLRPLISDLASLSSSTQHLRPSAEHTTCSPSGDRTLAELRQGSPDVMHEAIFRIL